MFEVIESILLVLAVFIVISVVVTGIILWLAPEGYQDETGFHYGREEDEHKNRIGL